MNAQSVKKHIKTEPTKLQSLVKYPELSNSELEVVCGGGGFLRRHHEEAPHKPKI
jgi:uridylate kinase